MKANELMFGDWVLYNPNVFIEDEYEPTKACYPTKICSGEDLDLAVEDCYAPIHLTPEILEKNGFSDDYRNDDLSYAQSCGDVIGIHINGKNGYMDEMYFDYVHQLQHALRLCGIDKTIEL